MHRTRISLCAAAVALAACTGEPTAPLATPTASLSVASDAFQAGPRRDILFQVREEATPDELQALQKVLKKHDMREGKRHAGGRLRQSAIRRDDSESEAAIAAAIEATGAVDFAEVDVLVPLASVPNDSLYSAQWHHTKINSASAWNVTTGSTGVLAAVCDGGIELTHPDLAANIAGPGYNVLDYTNDGGPMPHSGGPQTGPTHGTKVAGLIGAVGNNTSGVAGMAWTIRLLSIRVSNDTMGTASLSKLVECIDYARTQGAKVVNMSYGVATSSSINTAGQALMSAGGLLFVSAGNDARSLSGKNLTGMIVVGGTNEADARATFSNYGASIDIVAPALNITTTRPTWRGSYISGETGTSFAAPIVAGVAALIWSVKPNLSPSTVQSILFTTAKDLGKRGYDTSFGNGRVDAAAALARTATYP